MRHPIIALAALSLTACQSMSPSDSRNTEAASAIQDWASAFNSCDAEKASTEYASDAVLWGTVAPTVISTPAGIRQYFERVCSSNPKPKVVLGEQLLRVYGETAVNSGSYTFTVFPAGQPLQFPARYSFTYRKKDGRWLIIDHHSSALPAQAPARP